MSRPIANIARAIGHLEMPDETLRRPRTHREIGARIRQAREKKGLTRAEFGALVSVSESAVQQWEAGTSVPRLEKVDPLCKWLEIPIEWLLVGGDFSAMRVAQTDEEEMILRGVRALPDDKRAMILSVITKLAAGASQGDDD